ncbi:MAG: hypothetical protein JWO05_1577 [Gemmatimonadetes bacterium]|nr:hypothetical protein [Gemmatimonadota bacterium]
MRPANTPISYVLPLRADAPRADAELCAYLAWLSARAEVIVVDASPAPVFAAHATAFSGVRHIPLDPARATPMGKVGNVLTGIAAARHECIIIADDDVRYDDRSLSQVTRALHDADVVRPQNYFTPLNWHAAWDTSRTLLNRLADGDWPGTLGVRRSVLLRTNGYDGSAMFENLELVRTVISAGGSEALLLDAFVARAPSTTRHFWSQRIRQAYDEFARPVRMAWQLVLLPLLAFAIARGAWTALAIAALASILLAEAGRRRANGRSVFPAFTTLFAPAWLIERALCSWLAVASRMTWGGVRYRDTILRHAATPLAELRARHASATMQPLPATAARRRSA